MYVYMCHARSMLLDRNVQKRYTHAEKTAKIVKRLI